jgi:NADPH2:quinone reductase
MDLARGLGACEVATSLGNLGEDLAILTRLVADGRLTPHVGLTLGWEETPRAFAALADRTLRGKAILTR